MSELRRLVWRLSEAERKFDFQKAKCRYIVDADRNTKLFHSIARRNASRNCIAAITRSVTQGMHEVADEFIRYYEETTTPVHQVDPTVFQIGATVPPDSLDMLTDRAVMFSIGTDRAPGPDGYSAGFFRHSWETVGGDVSAAVKEFFESGRLLRQLPHTLA